MIIIVLYYNNLINLTSTRTERQLQRTYVRTLACATYFKSVEHINEFVTYINHRNVIGIYKEY